LLEEFNEDREAVKVLTVQGSFFKSGQENKAQINELGNEASADAVEFLNNVNVIQERLIPFAQQVAIDYRGSLLKKTSIDPGSIKVYLVGGRANGSLL